MTEPFPSRLAVPSDTFRALVQMQIDYYAVQGNAGPDWTKRAEEDIAAAFCPSPPAPASSLSPWIRRVREAQLAEEAREARADDNDEAMGDWTR